eukprot:6195547-Prymnesium_polylepis.1
MDPALHPPPRQQMTAQQTPHSVLVAAIIAASRMPQVSLIQVYPGANRHAPPPLRGSLME